MVGNKGRLQRGAKGVRFLPGADAEKDTGEAGILCVSFQVTTPPLPHICSLLFNLL